MLLEFGAGPVADIATDELILLGEYGGRAVFTIEIEADTPPVLSDGAEFADLRLVAGLLPHDEAGLLAYARAMVSFRHRHRLLRQLRGSDTAAARRPSDAVQQ